jgi:hypothetical protein
MNRFDWIFRKASWVVSIASILVGCGGGGSSAITYTASINCWNGVALTSTVSQAVADALPPAGCATLSSATSAAVNFGASTDIGATTVGIVLNVLNLPANLTVAPSSIVLSDPGGKSYTVGISTTPFKVTATPQMPFASLMTVKSGSLSFANAPAIDLSNKTFNTPAVPIGPSSRLTSGLPPFFVGSEVNFDGATSAAGEGLLVGYDWTFGDGLRRICETYFRLSWKLSCSAYCDG